VRPQPAVVANAPCAPAAPVQPVMIDVAAVGQAPSQVQANPFASGVSAAGLAGAPPASAYANQSAPAGQPTVQTIPPAMPANAMPRSYRNPATDVAPTAPATTATVAGPATPAPTAQAATVPQAGPAATAAAAPATPATTVAAAKARPQLPPGAPPVAFDGCCPVTLKTLKRWTPGNSELGVVHRGRTYLFVGETERQQFWADPDAYSPVFAGLDPVLLLEQQKSVEGSRKFGYEYGGLFYLFSSEETKQRFAASPSSYAAGVRQAMSRIDGAQNGVIRR
jgi:YHS domain-containing protein